MGKIKAVFIDRDGTLNADLEGYIDKPDRLKLFPYSGQSIRILNEQDFKVFVVTNQSGIARGYYTFEDLDLVHGEMNRQLKNEGAFVDEIFISPYFKDGDVEPYNIEHEDRKPGLGLFKKARSSYDLDLSGSFMIGDKYSDIEFGKKAGLITILVLSGNGTEEFLNKRKGWEYQPDFIVKDLSVAVSIIIDLGDKI